MCRSRKLMICSRGRDIYTYAYILLLLLLLLCIYKRGRKLCRMRRTKQINRVGQSVEFDSDSGAQSITSYYYSNRLFTYIAYTDIILNYCYHLSFTTPQTNGKLWPRSIKRILFRYLDLGLC